MIKEQFVIGLISPELRTFIDGQIKFNSTLLLAGPEQSGKTLLINAICTETGSLKIQLDYKILSESYRDKKKIKLLAKKILMVMAHTILLSYDQSTDFYALKSTKICRENHENDLCNKYERNLSIYLFKIYKLNHL